MLLYRVLSLAALAGGVLLCHLRGGAPRDWVGSRGGSCVRAGGRLLHAPGGSQACAARILRGAGRCARNTGRADYRLFHKASWDEFDLDRTALARFLNASDTDRVLRDAMARFVPAAFGFRGVLEQDLDQTALLTSAAYQSAAEDVKRRTGTWHPYFLESANVRWVAEFQQPGSEPPVAIRDIGAHPRYWFASRLHGDPLADHLVTSETSSWQSARWRSPRQS